MITADTTNIPDSKNLYKSLVSWLIAKEPVSLYPVPQNAPHVSVGMNVLDFPEGPGPKAPDVSPWYGVYWRI